MCCNMTDSGRHVAEWFDGVQWSLVVHGGVRMDGSGVWKGMVRVRQGAAAHENCVGRRPGRLAPPYPASPRASLYSWRTEATLSCHQQGHAADLLLEILLWCADATTMLIWGSHS